MSDKTAGAAHTLDGQTEFRIIPGLLFWIAVALECGHFIEIDLRDVLGAIEDEDAHVKTVVRYGKTGDWRGYVEYIAGRLDGRDLREAISEAPPLTHELAH